MGKVFDDFFLYFYWFERPKKVTVFEQNITKSASVGLYVYTLPSCMGGFEKKKSTRPSSIMLLFFFSFNNREKKMQSILFPKIYVPFLDNDNICISS